MDPNLLHHQVIQNTKHYLLCLAPPWINRILVLHFIVLNPLVTIWELKIRVFCYFLVQQSYQLFFLGICGASVIKISLIKSHFLHFIYISYPVDESFQ